MATVDLFDRIMVEPGKCGGKPCIREMRITVRRACTYVMQVDLLEQTSAVYRK
jgi:uncharacterized protein (DUF433 family)